MDFSDVRFTGNVAMSVDTKPPPCCGEIRDVRDALVQKLSSDVGLFALGSAVSRVVQLSASDDEAAHNLAYYVLSDVALTQKILCLSNSVTYRRVVNTPVTTISRAIFMLGFDTVKTSALAMLLVDSLSNHKHAQSIRAELADALRASLVGRELARHSHYQGAEEASIAALFKNLGRLLVTSHEHACLRQIEVLVAAGEHSPAQASAQVLGCSYEALAEAVLTEWNIPATIIHALGAVPAGRQRAAANRQEWMRQVASFSVEASKLIARPDAEVEADRQKLLARFGAALNLDTEKMRELFASVAEEMRVLSDSLKLGGADIKAADAGSGMPDVLLMMTMGADAKAEGFHPSGKPVNARDLLLAGVQDVIQMRALGRSKVNELILLVLETLYRSMGFRFATMCLKDTKSGQFRARVALGEGHASRQARFVFQMTPERDLFQLSMENNTDLMISDASSEKIRDLLPAWHRALLPDARSFIVLPLVVQKVQIGLFYADRVLPASEGLPPDETALIKALKSQILAALSGT
ncbi:HDOD domain-containing protein [Candidatus Nitrotoga sp. 1052]|uniref:HDOD domain-containing protein n=1 Tax=Candidatus Nitrotoga sp. 1052 TaxID=2886964 RepID=UPI001EF49168|nr:HDOD domain-containing protein [Candidatus Nitrotoga sp. 1052]CAH1085631.1 Predicted signal transduction protein [Candidatus Nitrotoga sp. 1052]